MCSLTTRVARRIFRVVFVLLACVGCFASAADTPAVRIVYLYDNTAAIAGAKAAWGFAALVEAHGKRVLFDTGGDANIFRQNVTALGVDLGQLDAVVISHEHWDHTNGIPMLGRHDGLPVFYPASSSESAPYRRMLKDAGMQPMPVTAMTSIAPHIAVSGEMKSFEAPEVALVIDTDDGLIVLVGCAHPGPDAMVAQIREGTDRPVLALLGGFHLLNAGNEKITQTVANFKAQAIRYLGPSHCTGAAAIAAIRQVWGERFVEGGVGTVIQALPLMRGTVR
jgi:7,8-dihydropterin-6-yl-methyl-4-(beta-D-ribofuranosyl)aminobenzene 5'-phosphate synthase